MRKEFLEEFLNQIELLAEEGNKEEVVKDTAGSYLKSSWIKHMVSDARELVKYGEYEIALENILENLNEVSLRLDEQTMELARQAFEKG